MILLMVMFIIVLIQMDGVSGDVDVNVDMVGDVDGRVDVVNSVDVDVDVVGGGE